MAKDNRGGKRSGTVGWTYNNMQTSGGIKTYVYNTPNGQVRSLTPPSQMLANNKLTKAQAAVAQPYGNPISLPNGNKLYRYIIPNAGGATGAITFTQTPISQQAQNQQPQQAQTQPAQPTPAPTPTPQQVQSGNIMPKGGVPFQQFEQMTDDQKANVINQALNQGVPAFLDNSDLQRFAYFTGMSDKPQIVTESQLKNMKGYSLWRSVHDSYNRVLDIGYKKEDIADQIMRGDYTNYSDSGGSAYGKAIYFDVQKGSYGSGSGYAIMHAKLSPNAKTISDSRADTIYTTAVRNGDKLALACRNADGASARNLYCLAKGYDVIVEYGWNNKPEYHMVLNRRGLVMSSTLH